MSSSSQSTILAGVAGALCGAAAVTLIYANAATKPAICSEDAVRKFERPEDLASLPPVIKNRFGGVGTELPSSDNLMWNGCIYLDYNATTPVYPEVADRMWPYCNEFFGNPSSDHVFGRPCKKSLQESRLAVAALVNAASSDRIIFTSCGSESDNRAIDIALNAFRRKQSLKPRPVGSPAIVPHVISSAIEHPAILVYLKDLEGRGEIALDCVPVNAHGVISVADVVARLQKYTALVTIMHSNNEIGTIQPIAEIAGAVKASQFGNGVLVHTDAAQSIGKTVVDAQMLGVDMLTIVGHKFGAPKGIAALFVKGDVELLQPFLTGGGQEGGQRAGTECIPLIVALGEASVIARRELATMILHNISLRIKLIRQLLAVDEKLKYNSGCSDDFVRFNGPPEVYDMEVLARCCENFDEAVTLSGVSLLNTVSVSIRGQSGHELVHVLGETQVRNVVACSAGSACHAAPSGGNSAVMSSVLAACGVLPEYGLGTLRLSTGRHTTLEEIDLAGLLLFLKLTEDNCNK